MKPLNLDNRPCSPISSNCVIWQGPELTCINLCKGDTISDVVANLATELCTLLDQTNVSNYDLTCLGITACGPKDFQALIELLIEKICEAQGLTPDKTTGDSTCPDCTVTVASCFIQNGQTTMQLIDYVNMIAERVCGLISDINNLQQQINDLTIRVEILEGAAPPAFTIPTVTFTCRISTLNPGQPYAVDVALQTFINDVWCPTATALGTPSDLISSYTLPCSFDTDVTTNPNWTPSPTTLAESMTNVWIVLCDLYAAVSGIALNVQDTNSIDLNYTGGILTANIADTGWEDLLGFNFYSGVAKPQCRRIGNQIHFRGIVYVPIDNEGIVIPLTSSNAYNSVPSCNVFAGGGGCFINTNGSIVFNNQTSVIPTTVLNSATNLDNTYRLGYVIGTRQIDLDATYGTALSAVFSVGITNTKQLYIAVLKDLEITSTRTNAANVGSSHLRYITSNVTAGEKVPDFTSTQSTVHSSPFSGNVNTVTLPAPLAPDTQYLNNLTASYNTFTYPFTCDAGLESQIGGFVVILDGLIAYVDPCTTDIKSYDCGKG
jgi:hypothetical protein